MVLTAWRLTNAVVDRDCFGVGVRLDKAPGVCIFTVVETKAGPVDFPGMDGCVCLALRRAARAVTQFYDHALRPHGLRVTQIPILWAASVHGSVPLATLAQKLGLDRTTLLRNVRPLVRRRLVSVGPAANSRRTEIKATAGGRALLARIYPVWKQAQEQALQSLEGFDWSRPLEALARTTRRVAS